MGNSVHVGSLLKDSVIDIDTRPSPKLPIFLLDEHKFCPAGASVVVSMKSCYAGDPSSIPSPCQSQ